MAKHKNKIGMSLSAVGQATREGLLDHVYKNTGCEYLSDLHDIRYRQTALELVLEAADDNYRSENGLTVFLMFYRQIFVVHLWKKQKNGA